MGARAWDPRAWHGIAARKLHLAPEPRTSDAGERRPALVLGGARFRELDERVGGSTAPVDALGVLHAVHVRLGATFTFFARGGASAIPTNGLRADEAGRSEHGAASLAQLRSRLALFGGAAAIEPDRARVAAVAVGRARLSPAGRRLAEAALRANGVRRLPSAAARSPVESPEVAAGSHFERRETHARRTLAFTRTDEPVCANDVTLARSALGTRNERHHRRPRGAGAIRAVFPVRANVDAHIGVAHSLGSHDRKTLSTPVHVAAAPVARAL